MNDPRKALNVSAGSLLSLKAELIRKKNAVVLAKNDQSNSEDYGPSTSKKMALKKKSVANKNDNKRAKDGEVFETEDSLMLEKSRRILEAKSRFYDKMARAGGGLNTDDNCLVLFNRKRQEEDGAGPSHTETSVMRSNESNDEEDEKVGKHGKVDKVEKYKKVDIVEKDEKVEKAPITVQDVLDMEEKKKNKEKKEKVSSDSEKEEENDDDWVEYTDCLGRTRKCLRKDLDECLRRDKDFRDGISSETKKPYWMVDLTETDSKDRKKLDLTKVISSRILKKEGTLGTPTMADMLKPNNAIPKTKLEEQRAAWEIKEQENLQKIDLHYQDVFFNEARLHGVSYFEFSTDPEERKKQQKELMAARRETLKQQGNFKRVKDKREQITKRRLFLARNRTRQRAGLEPFNWEEFEEDYYKNKLPPLEKKVYDPEEELRKWKERREKTRIEVLQELDRRARIRPWDEGKQGASGFSVNLANIDGGWRYAADRVPMSQEEWNEKMREERKPEFAPMPEPVSKPPIKPKRKNFTCIPSLTAKPILGDFIPLQTTKPKFKKRSYEGANDEGANDEGDNDESDNDESDNDESDNDESDNDESDNDEDYDEEQEKAMASDTDGNYGSGANKDHDSDSNPDSDSDSKQTSGGEVNLETSIDAGLKFLREQSDKGKAPKESWTSNADY